VFSFHEISVRPVEMSLDGIRTFRPKANGFGEISNGVVVLPLLAIGLASVKEDGGIGSVLFGLIRFDLNQFGIVGDGPVVVALVKSQGSEVASPQHGYKFGVLSPGWATLRLLSTGATLRADCRFFSQFYVALRAGPHLVSPSGCSPA